MKKDYKKMYFDILELLEEAAQLLNQKSINIPRVQKAERKRAFIKAVDDLFRE